MKRRIKNLELGGYFYEFASISILVEIRNTARRSHLFNNTVSLVPLFLFEYF